MEKRQLRGELTKRIKIKSQELLGYKIDVVELRLMPYVMHILMNDQKIDIYKINEEEKEIIKKWRKIGYITRGTTRLGVTVEFWGILCEIIRLGYVDID